MKVRSFAVIAIVVVFWSVAVVMAQTTTIITRDVTVKGDAVRGPLVAGLVGNYFADTRATATSDNSLGEYVMVTGPGGTEKIHFSPKLVERLQKLSGNARAGDGLLNICPTQAGQLVRVVGPLKMVQRKEDPKITITKDDCGKPKAVLEGCNGTCWTRSPTGTYFNIGTLAGVSVVGNINNPKYSATNVSAKMQVEGGRWVPKVVVRNQEMSANDIFQSAGLQSEISAHLARISSLVVGKSGREGDSCFEKTWRVREDRQYFVLKDES